MALLFGATGIAGRAIELGRLLLQIFLALPVVCFTVGGSSGRSLRQLP
jgi:uncharacterized membrane protein YtjA (UPF0391 family)